jgi:hypothetical protein
MATRTTYTPTELRSNRSDAFEQAVTQARLRSASHDLLVGGKRRPGRGGTLEERSPAEQREELGVFAAASAEDVAEAAIEACAAAGGVGPHERRGRRHDLVASGRSDRAASCSCPCWPFTPYRLSTKHFSALTAKCTVPRLDCSLGSRARSTHSSTGSRRALYSLTVPRVGPAAGGPDSRRTEAGRDQAPRGGRHSDRDTWGSSYASREGTSLRRADCISACKEAGRQSRPR